MTPDTSIDYLDTAFNILNEAVFVYDEKLQIKYFNKAAERITGFSKDEVLGQKCITILDKKICLNNCELCMTVKNGLNESVHFNSPFMRKDGAKRIGDFQAGVLRRDPSGTEVLVSLNDITELEHLRKEVQEVYSFDNIVGRSRVMKDLFDTIQNVASYDSTVFLHGESGTGKELVANAIHYASPRAGKNLVKVNCSSFSDSLLESELFGHVKGAFTGAINNRIGRFEEAHGGTIFLDEVGDLNPNTQVKLLRVLQEKEIERVGENVTRKVDLRIIAATNKNLMKEVQAGRFREDLYYRLNVIPVHLPPLRDRKEDIPCLTDHFIKKWKTAHKKKISGIASEALGALMDHPFPGNVRELENLVEHACVKSSGPQIEIRDLPAYLAGSPSNGKKKQRRKWLTRELVDEALKKSGNNQTRAAQLLDVHRITLWRKIKEFEIPV